MGLGPEVKMKACRLKIAAIFDTQSGRTVRRGEVLDCQDPLVRRFPSYFEEVELPPAPPPEGAATQDAGYTDSGRSKGRRRR